MNGIYTAYLTGKAGNNLALLLLKDGIVSGADLVGGLFDGTYTLNEGGSVSLNLQITVPAGFPTLTGQPPEKEAKTVSFAATLPQNFLMLPFVRIDGETGPVNAAIKKIREV